MAKIGPVEKEIEREIAEEEQSKKVVPIAGIEDIEVLEEEAEDK